MAAAERTACPGHARLCRVAQHLIGRSSHCMAPPLPGIAGAAAFAEPAGSVALSLRQPRALGPEDFIMGSPGNWQTAGGIVLNEEQRAIETLTAAMRSGIKDFVRLPAQCLPPCQPAHQLVRRRRRHG